MDTLIVLSFVIGYVLLSWAVLSSGTGRVERRASTARVVASWPPDEWTAHRPEPRASVHEQWCNRRASESPIFARLAAEMGLGLALGVAA